MMFDEVFWILSQFPQFFFRRHSNAFKYSSKLTKTPLNFASHCLLKLLNDSNIINVTMAIPGKLIAALEYVKIPVELITCSLVNLNVYPAVTLQSSFTNLFLFNQLVY